MKPASQRADRILSGKYLMPTWRQQDVIENGGAAIHQDTIIAVGSRKQLRAQFPDCPELHEPSGLVMPGLINTHTHAAMACFRGIADDLPLMTWLQEHIFPVEARLDPEIVYHSTLLSLAEMIKSGTTSFCDMYLFTKEVARATAESGMRGWIGEALYDFPSPSYGQLSSGYRYVEDMFNQYHHHPLITPVITPHSVYTCAPSLLERCAEMAQAHDTLLVIHLSETESEVATCIEQYGKTPVRHLDEMGLLNGNTLAAHCVKLDKEDIELIAAHDVKISHCIESNMKLASGIAPVPELLKKGVTVSFGTDGSASNNDVDMFSEMSSIAKIHKGFTHDPTVLDAETTLHGATMGGATALQMQRTIGTIEPGKKADLIVLDLNQLHLTPLYHIPSHLVYAARGNDVIHSLINGRLVMKNRELLTLNEEEIVKKMKGISRKILTFREEAATHV